jgi:hypothetical protein
MARKVTRRRASRRADGVPTDAIEISGELNRLDTEAVRIQLQLIAKRHGVKIAEFKIREQSQSDVSS